MEICAPFSMQTNSHYSPCLGYIVCECYAFTLQRYKCLHE